MIQRISERYNIKTVLFNCVQLVDFVAIKHEIKIVQIKHITRDDV